jgi:hypothetical protein
MPCNSRLTTPVQFKDGRVVCTLADARDVVLALPEKERRRRKWQQLIDVLVTASESIEPAIIAIATHRLKDALRNVL